MTNRSPVVQSATGNGRESANLIANVTANVTSAQPAQVNLSERSVDAGIVENPTYARPTNKPITDASPASLNPTETTQPGDSTDVQQEAGATEDADNNAQQEKTNDESSSVPSTQEQYSDVELKQISALKTRDTEVLTHERAHSSVGGQYAGSPSYSYQTGPDGVKYAVGGEVSIDTSKVPNDPQATLQKAQQIKAAALAPAEPSGQDRRVAAKAEQMAAQARSDILQENQGKSDNSAKTTKSISRSESFIPEHFSGVQYLQKENDFQQKLNNRIEQISSLYQNSSVSKNSSTFQTQI